MQSTNSKTDAAYVMGHPVGTENLNAESYVKQMREEVLRQRSCGPRFFMAGAWARKATFLK